MLHLRTLDECSFAIGDTRLAPEAELLFAFLLFLTMERGRRIPRAQVLDLFWPGASDENARHCLRQTVYKLRQLGVAVESTQSHLTLPADRVTRDFDALFTPSAYEVDGTGAATVVGDFLPGYAPRLSAAYAEWLEQQRIHVQTGVRRALMSALSDRRSRGRWLEVEALARRCLDLDPLNEEATLALAEAAAMSGAKARAIEILDEYLAEIGDDARDIRLPATILRRRIAERLPSSRYAATDSCFVGRADSMAFLSERLRATRVGRGGGCLIWGDAGIGKTRLAHEFGRMATLQGAQVQRVKCQASDPGRPLSIWVDVVPALLNLPGALGCSPRSLGYLKRLTEHDVTSLEPSEETREAEFLYANVRQALFDVVDAVASEAPLLIVVEDVHWLDRMSWQVLREMIEWAHERRLQFVLTSRTFGVTPEGRTEPVRGFDRHRLTSLAEEEATELLRATLREHRATLSDRLRGWCLSIGDGNPLYLRELAAYWLATEDTSRVPPTLEALIDERVARLGPDELRALQACAVLGVNSTLERIEALLERRTHELLATLEELERYGLTHAVDSRVLVHHDLIGAAALKRSSESALKLMHRRAGLLLEQEIERTQNASLLWDAARHWRNAGEAARAITPARSCGQHLLFVGLPMEAASVFELALEFSHDITDRAQLLEDQALALRSAGQWNNLRRVCASAVALRRAGGSFDHVHDELELDRIEADWRHESDPAGLLRAVCACVESPAATPAHRVRAARLALVFADNLAEFDCMRTVYNRTLPLLTLETLSAIDRRILQLIYETSLGDLDEAKSHGEQLLLLVKRERPAREALLSYRYAAYAFRYAGALRESIALLTHSFEIATQQRNPTAISGAGSALVRAMLDLGDLDGAAYWIHRAAPLSATEQNPTGQQIFRTARARYAAATGDLSTLRGLVNWSASDISSDPIVRQRREHAALWLELRLLEGDLDHVGVPQVVAAAAAAHARLHAGGGQDYPVTCLAKTLSRLGQASRAAAILEEYLASSRRERTPVPMIVQSALAEARALSQLGADPATARESKG